MRKFLSMVFILSICISLFACGKSKCLHSETDWIIATEPTCTTEGLKVLSCEKCGEKTQIIPAIGHTWKNATCTVPKTCDNCNAIEGIALGHSYKQQTSGKDICTTCKDEAYATYSIMSLSNIYAMLKDPSSAVISSIYAGKYNYGGDNCIVVVISLKAKNSYGAMVGGEYVSLFYLEKKEAIYDMKGYAESQADYYQILANRAFGASKTEYLNKRIEYLHMVSDANTISSKKTTIFEKQELDYIIRMSKGIVGIS